INNQHNEVLDEDRRQDLFWQPHDGDEQAATRRAIVRAASEMGKTMESEILVRKTWLEEQEANDRLIAAAPELLEALEQSLAQLHSIHSKYGDKSFARESSAALRMAEDAIAKAIGGTNDH